MRFLPVLCSLALLLASGCEDDKETRPWYDPVSGTSGSSSASSTSSSSKKAPAALVGTWSLTNGGSTWFIHFSSDGSWRITDDAAGAKRRVYGSFTADDSSFSGPMTNPGVGTGAIAGHYNGRSMTLDFAEYWHTPTKHVSYVGTKR